MSCYTRPAFPLTQVQHSHEKLADNANLFGKGREMRKLSDMTVQAFAVLLVAGTGLVVYRLAYSGAVDPMAPLAASAAWTPSSETQIPAELVTYRFLYPDEPGGAAGRLILARFVDDDPVPSRTWESQSVEHWRGWTPGIFAREMQWVAEDQPGWQISTWLSVDGPTEYDRDYLFWSIQALRFLDPEDAANMIDMIDRSGKAARIRLTQGSSDYDYAGDTLYWNPAVKRDILADKSPGEEPTTTHPLATLAHQLSHMCHDLCDNGDSADDKERQRIALAAEHRVRDILSRKDPARPRTRSSAATER
jgi:hypothetical protein